MSSTEIYLVKDGAEPILIGRTRNAFRGAMYVWNDIARRYFGLESFPFFDESEMSKVWNAESTHNLSEHEKIVLNSTMDKITVKISDCEKLCDAFDAYATEHPNSSISEQSKIIRQYATENSEADGVIAWTQTSVSEGWFTDYEEQDDGESITVCDLSSAYDLFENLGR